MALTKVGNSVSNITTGGGGSGVSSFNTRTGAVVLLLADVTEVLGFTPANINSPAFTGNPTATTQTVGNDSTRLATTAFVQAAVVASTTGVSAFNTRTGAVTLTSGDVTTALGYTPVNPASAALTGSPTAPTQVGADNSTKIATTAYVTSKVAAGGGGVTSFNSRTGAITLSSGDVTGALGYTPPKMTHGLNFVTTDGAGNSQIAHGLGSNPSNAIVGSQQVTGDIFNVVTSTDSTNIYINSKYSNGGGNAASSNINIPWIAFF